MEEILRTHITMLEQTWRYFFLQDSTCSWGVYVYNTELKNFGWSMKQISGLTVWTCYP